MDIVGLLQTKLGPKEKINLEGFKTIRYHGSKVEIDATMGEFVWLSNKV